MALSNADRASDLCTLDIRYLSLLPESTSFWLAVWTKSARADTQITSFYSSLEDKSLSYNYLEAVPEPFSNMEGWPRQEPVFLVY